MSPTPSTHALFAHKGDEISLALHSWNRKENASKQDICRGLAYSLRIRLIDGLLKSEETCRRQGAKCLVPFCISRRPVNAQQSLQFRASRAIQCALPAGWPLTKQV
jgi:hypothetical protein